MRRKNEAARKPRPTPGEEEDDFLLAQPDQEARFARSGLFRGSTGDVTDQAGDYRGQQRQRQLAVFRSQTFSENDPGAEKNDQRNDTGGDAIQDQFFSALVRGVGFFDPQARLSFG
jgi:hypothetical protein